MKAKTPDPQMNLYSFSMKLEHICNHSNEIYQLANRIDWSVFEDALSPLFCEDNGRPTKSIRLVVGLQILKAVFTESDENVVEKWLQNPYWQYFCGEVEFQHEFPLDPSSIGKWRKRIKKEGFEKILEASIDAALKTGTVTKRDLTHVNVDTTVLEKAVAFPTDAKLYHKMRENLVAEADRLNVKLRQTYIRKSKKALIMVGRYAHARQMKRSNASLRSVKVYFGRVLRDLDRKTKAHQDEKLKSMLELGYRLFKTM
jgi:IS5 family transposase